MTTIICSGSLFSGWCKTFKNHVPANMFSHVLNEEISSIGKKICERQYPSSDELEWVPFTPDIYYRNEISQLLSNRNQESLVTWDDGSSCLYLGFWAKIIEDARFLLFFSSPEIELSNYINSHPFEASRIEKVTNAWIIRTRAMLTFYMNNRNRSLLIDVQCVNQADGAFSQVLKNHFELIVEPSPPITSQQPEKSALVEFLATTLLLQNQAASTLYDEVRSAATLISESAKSISSIQKRNFSLISAFLEQVATFEKLDEAHLELREKLSQSQHLIRKKEKELEDLLQSSVKQDDTARQIVNYLSTDPLLKIARQARKLQ